MKLVKGTSIYTFPTYCVCEPDAETRSDTTDKAFSHGGITTGDKKLKPRELTIEINVVEPTTTSEYRSTLDDITRALLRGTQKFYIDDDRYINVDSFKTISQTYEKGFKQIKSETKIVLNCPDPFFYEETPLSQEITITESPQTFIVTNGGVVDTPPIITIEPTAVNSILSLVNTTDNSRTFSYSDASFGDGDSLVINSTDGTVKRDGTNVLNNVGGTFLQLLAGDNSITYTGPLGTITFNYTQRWL